MIWQEEVYNIVCLTNLTEGTKVNTQCIHSTSVYAFIIASEMHRRYCNQKLRFRPFGTHDSLR